MCVLIKTKMPLNSVFGSSFSSPYTIYDDDGNKIGGQSLDPSNPDNNYITYDDVNGTPTDGDVAVWNSNKRLKTSNLYNISTITADIDSNRIKSDDNANAITSIQTEQQTQNTNILNNANNLSQFSADTASAQTVQDSRLTDLETKSNNNANAITFIQTEQQTQNTNILNNANNLSQFSADTASAQTVQNARLNDLETKSDNNANAITSIQTEQQTQNTNILNNANNLSQFSADTASAQNVQNAQLFDLETKTQHVTSTPTKTTIPDLVSTNIETTSVINCPTVRTTQITNQDTTPAPAIEISTGTKPTVTLTGYGDPVQADTEHITTVNNQSGLLTKTAALCTIDGSITAPGNIIVNACSAAADIGAPVVRTNKISNFSTTQLGDLDIRNYTDILLNPTGKILASKPVEVVGAIPDDTHLVLRDNVTTTTDPVGFVSSVGSVDGTKWLLGGVGVANEVVFKTFNTNDNIKVQTQQQDTLQINNNGTVMLNRNDGTNAPYVNAPNAILKLNTDGTIEKSNATVTTNGQLECKDVNTTEIKTTQTNTNLKMTGLNGKGIEIKADNANICFTGGEYAGNGPSSKAGKIIEISDAKGTLVAVDNPVSVTTSNQIGIGPNVTTEVDNECVIGDESLTHIRNKGNGTCDLGTGTTQFKNIYFSGDLYKNGSLFSGGGGGSINGIVSTENPASSGQYDITFNSTQYKTSGYLKVDANGLISVSPVTPPETAFTIIGNLFVNEYAQFVNNTDTLLVRVIFIPNTIANWTNQDEFYVLCDINGVTKRARVRLSTYQGGTNNWDLLVNVGLTPTQPQPSVYIANATPIFGGALNYDTERKQVVEVFLADYKAFWGGVMNQVPNIYKSDSIAGEYIIQYNNGTGFNEQARVNLSGYSNTGYTGVFNYYAYGSAPPAGYTAL
jgi:hypothetical protein